MPGIVETLAYLNTDQIKQFDHQKHDQMIPNNMVRVKSDDGKSKCLEQTNII